MAKLPDSIGKYKVESLIAKGGMGAVYKAIHPTLNRPVIIKKLTLRGRKDITERFKREARILMDFRHDGVVNMYDHFKLGLSYYIVLEFVDGVDLDAVIKKQRYLDSGIVAYILYHSAQSLYYAHEKKVVHRDIKPANLLLSKSGDIKLVDFGIAVSDEDSEEGLTREGMTLGTPSYMAPEQFSNTKNVDLRADVYSLGVLVYEMLTGKKPFPGGFSPELVVKIQKGKYPNPLKFNPHIHPVLLRFIRKSMKPKLDRRYNDLKPVIKEMEHFLSAYDKEELINIVKDIAEGNDGWKPKFKSKRRFLIRIMLPVIAGIMLLLGGSFCYFTAYHNGLFRNRTYDPVIFSVQSTTETQPWNKIFINAEIFEDDNNLIPKAWDKKILFRKIQENKIDKTYSFRSLPVYLPHGSYRAKVEIEDELYWHSFVVIPGKNKKFDPFMTKIIQIHSGQEKGLKVPISYTIDIRNILTGDPIKDRVGLSISSNGNWVEINDSETLMTGSVYKFRIEHEEFYSKIFSLRIKDDQNILKIQAGLLPLSMPEDLKFLIK
jgi:eukaryotic-like serine/threonine-protein kinase